MTAERSRDHLDSATKIYHRRANRREQEEK